jgi:hypothetical protein
MVVTWRPRPGRQRGAALHRLAVDMHDAGAALAGVAADMGAGQAEVFAQELNQQRDAGPVVPGAMIIITTRIRQALPMALRTEMQRFFRAAPHTKPECPTRRNKPCHSESR